MTFVKGHKYNLGIPRSSETKKKMSISRLTPRLISVSVKNLGVGMLGKKHRQETIEKMRIKAIGRKHSVETIKKFSGSNNKNWKGGVTSVHKTIRNSYRFKNWRLRVFKRDNYTCQNCGKRGGELHPDHIKQFAYHEDLRFDVANGRTLCKNCHIKTETYGAKSHKCCKK